MLNKYHTNPAGIKNYRARGSGRKLFTVIFLVFFPFSTWSADNREIIYETSGIGREDIQDALGKKELTLFDAYALAVKNSPVLSISSEKLSQAHSHRHQAIGYILPRISLKGNAIFLQEDNKSTGSLQTNVSIYAKQPIITGLDEANAFRISNREIKAARHELSFSAGRLLNDTAFNFFQIIQLEKTLKNSREIRDLYAQTIQELNRRVIVGKSRKSDLLRTMEQLYRIDASTRSLESEVLKYRLALRTSSGIPVDAALVENFNLADPELPENEIGSLVEKRWDVLSAREQVKIAEINIWASADGQLPSVYLEGAYRLYRENPGTQSEYYGALGFEIPLLSGETVGKVEESFSLKRQAELNLAAVKKSAEEEIRDSYQAWESSKEETEAYRRALEASEKNYQVIMNEYRLNLVSILDVITALESLLNARNDYTRIVLQKSLDRIRFGIAVNEFPGKGMKSLHQSLPQ